MKKIVFLSFLFIIFFTPFKVNALAQTGEISGVTSVVEGSKFSLIFAITETSNLNGIESVIAYDSNHFSIVNTTNLAGSRALFFNNVNGKYVDEWADASPKSGTVQFLKVEFQAKAGFTAGTKSTVSMTNTYIAQGIIETAIANKSITLTSVAAKSTINSLSNITIDGLSISDFKTTTFNYTLPDTEATSILINADRTDSKSTLSGTGAFALNYGKNSFKLTVRSESGSDNTYTINVTRLDLRGDDTSIKSISIGDLILEWNKDDSSKNRLLVASSISQVELVVTLNESSSKVTSVLNHSLVGGENSIEITVQSEKGTIQTYTVVINRAVEVIDAPGDMNQDGRSSITDLVLLHRLILEIDPSNSALIIIGDMNNDGRLSVTDLVILHRTLLGLE